jgi:6-phosphogluconolactonase
MNESGRTISSLQGEVWVFPDAAALSRAAADEFARAAEEAAAARGRFTVALAGGTTPRGIYALLATDELAGTRKLPWPKCQIFFGDERPVRPDQPDSNFRMAREALLGKVPIPLDNIHRIRAELYAQMAAEDYEDTLRSVFGLRPGAWPRFDLIMLGLGADGHTASLFPNTEALKETSRLVAPNRVPSLKSHRITLTLPVLNAAAEVMFVVSGAEKARTLSQVLDHAPSGQSFPAQSVRPQSGRLLWLVDEAAARLFG